MVPAHTKHHSFSDVPCLIEGSAVARRLLGLVGLKPQPLSAAATLRLICDAVAAFCRGHYAGRGQWPVEGGGGPGSGGLAAAAAAAAASGGGGLAAGSGASEGADDIVVTDEADELAAESRAAGAARAPAPLPAAAEAAPARAPLPPAPHVPVAAGEAAAFTKWKEEGLLRILEVYE
jgi:hypothetical protein